MSSEPIESAATRNLKKAPDELRKALKDYLVGILAADELSPRMLLQLEQAASFAHRLLIVAGDPRALRPGRNNFGLGGMNDVLVPDDIDMGAAIAGMPSSGPLAPAPFGMPENFGAESLRHLMATLGKPKLADLLDSLKMAKQLHERAPGGSEERKKYESWIASLQAQIDSTMGELEPAEPVTSVVLEGAAE